MQKENSSILWIIGGVAVLAIIMLLSSMMNNPESESTAVQNIINSENEVTNNQNMKNIVETAIGAGQFNTLVTAVEKAGLVSTLSGEGPFTVFAPTDEAFKKLPEGTVEALLADTQKLTAVLTYHVVAGKVMSSDVVKITEATTVQGGKLKIDTSNGVKINNANVTTADIETSNGVIHVIDTVLIPE